MWKTGIADFAAMLTKYISQCRTMHVHTDIICTVAFASKYSVRENAVKYFFQL